MDMPPPQNIAPVSQVNIIDYNSIRDDEHECYYLLSFIDDVSVPEHVKQFARDNNCRYLEKSDYWSHKKYKQKGGVYSCTKNKKREYIFDNSKKLRFAKSWETYKIRHTF